jgi:hypothetical protein
LHHLLKNIKQFRLVNQHDKRFAMQAIWRETAQFKNKRSVVKPAEIPKNRSVLSSQQHDAWRTDFLKHV